VGVSYLEETGKGGGIEEEGDQIQKGREGVGGERE
jgi:hypothetical protein